MIGSKCPKHPTKVNENNLQTKDEVMARPPQNFDLNKSVWVDMKTQKDRVQKGLEPPTSRVPSKTVSKRGFFSCFYDSCIKP